MSEVPVHFLGFLANVDHSLAGMKMGDGFVVEWRSNNDLVPFPRRIDKYYGSPNGFGFLPLSYGCVIRTDLARFEGTPQGDDEQSHVEGRTSEDSRCLRFGQRPWRENAK